MENKQTYTVDGKTYLVTSIESENATKESLYAKLLRLMQQELNRRETAENSD